MFERSLQAVVQKTGHYQARFGLAVQHLLDGIKHAVIDSFTKGDMQGRRTLHVLDRDHGGGLKQKSRDFRGAAQSCGRRQDTPDRARPLPGQRRSHLMFGGKSKSLEPLPNFAAAGDTLGLDGDAQFFRRNLLPGEQQQAQRNTMCSRSCIAASGSQLLNGVAENFVKAFVGAIP